MLNKSHSQILNSSSIMHDMAGRDSWAAPKQLLCQAKRCGELCRIEA